MTITKPLNQACTGRVLPAGVGTSIQQLIVQTFGREGGVVGVQFGGAGRAFRG